MQVSFPGTTAVPPPPMPVSPGAVVRPRNIQLAGFVAAGTWYFCAKALSSSAANGIGSRFGLADVQPLIEAVFLLFLVVVGIGLLAGAERRKAPLRLTLGLPRRRSAGKEWAEGAALGWALAAVCVLPMLLGRALDARLWTGPRAWELAALNLLTLAILTLAHALGIYGYALQRLIEATGPVRATILLALLASIFAAFSPGVAGPPGVRILITVLATVLLSLCWIRTHGLWLLWGLHFAWAAATSVVFGLPLGGSDAYTSVVETRVFGPDWLTGGDFGPSAALLSGFWVLLAIAALVRMTRDYAWDYTHRPIIPAGLEVEVPPPAAHSTMESAAAIPAAAPPLVQILPVTPRTSAEPPPVE